ncbi:hypothetical protein [Phycicoccus avicenniae]|uniref:hypothetical protein n=1 Tax=Phycicoccus avicenniae TaxID=2828860 RepID=UPI003D274006
MDDDQLRSRLRELAVLAEQDGPAAGDDFFDRIIDTSVVARRRRAGRVTVLMGVAVAGAVLVPQLWSAWTPERALPAAPRTTTPVTHYTWTDWPTPTTPTPTPSNAVAVPDVLPDPAQLGDLDYSEESPVEYPLSAPVFGAQSCDPTQADSPPGPDATHQLATVLGSAWTADQSRSVNITVSVWSDGRGWQQLVDDTGPCRWARVAPAPWPEGAPPGDALYLEGTYNAHQSVVVRRVGRVIVSVVTLDVSDARARTEALRLVGIVVANLEESGWSWASDR